MMKSTKLGVLRQLYTLVIMLFFALLGADLFAESVKIKAENLTPVQVVKAAVSDVLTEMRANEVLYKNDPTKINELINQKVVPYFDFSRMTRLAMTTYWHSATESQRLEVAEAFQNLFVRTYGKQFFDYRDSSADIEAVTEATEKKASLKLQARSQRGDDVTLFLRLEKRIDKWKIIDVNVDGVSYVVTMRGQFSDNLSQKGVDGLILFLKDAVEQRAP
jgi:phospholipid transport system substrate-binding protein